MFVDQFVHLFTSHVLRENLVPERFLLVIQVFYHMFLHYQRHRIIKQVKAYLPPLIIGLAFEKSPHKIKVLPKADICKRKTIVEPGHVFGEDSYDSEPKPFDCSAQAETDVSISFFSGSALKACEDLKKY